MRSAGEGPGLLAGILRFPSWRLSSSVLWAPRTPPAFGSFPATEEEGWAFLGLRGMEKRASGRLPNGAGFVRSEAGG